MPLQHLKRLPIVLVCLFSWAALSATLNSLAAPSACPTIYNGNNGWVIDLCESDPAISTPMQVAVDGVAHGNAALVRIYHKSQNGPGAPQVAVLYASGYVRLKQNADPASPIPFGSSFILGPAYWSNSSTYYHHPQLNQLTIDTTWLPNGPLRLQAIGTNHAFNVAYELVMPPPRDRQTRLHVSQTYTAAAGVTIPSARRNERQGFKLMQVSSMFINQGSVCAGGQTDCHDSNAARFIGDDLVRHQVAFSGVTPSAFIFSSTRPLSNTWLDVLHTDDQSWQGNTPNVRIALDTRPLTRTITPQGWISATANPNDDNVGLWLHDDGLASQSWVAGQADRVEYWLLAQDNPPEPWADLGLRSGFTFLDFESSYNCFLVLPSDRPVTATLAPSAGYTDTALQLSYNLGSGNGNWAQARCNFDPPLDLSAYDHLRFDWRGDPAGANSLEVGLISKDGSQEHIFARGYHHPAHRAWWGQLVIPFNFLHPWATGTTFDPSQVSALFVSVVKDPVDDVGGFGRMAIDNLNAYNVISRTVPLTLEVVSPTHPIASTAAANWLGRQQTNTGLLKSWQEETDCVAHTYDQALALLVFTKQAMWTRAFSITQALSTTQNANGAWFKSRNCLTLTPVHTEEWEGDIAWAVYALSRYIESGGTHPQAAPVRDRAADWLLTRINPADGCLVIDHTEGTLDAWWALQAAGPDYREAADGLKRCLLTHYWDGQRGRFKGGQNWQQPYLDNQTWGAAFLSAIGAGCQARRALNYARDTLRLPAQGGQLFGFDGQGGPWSVWNEGTGQYIAVGGEGANDLLIELLAQQRVDGAMPGSPDDFSGGGVWTTRWHGVAPTAWLYFALNTEPFHPRQAMCVVYLPSVTKNR
ncbi:MAG TPA: carbohydrate binding domain-containing protein [Anaerolineae bacterium]|nr:carbohydrate binding domain-containing protein [Anaerolineae bacterium]